MARVLIVDDSLVFQKLLMHILEKDTRLEVIGTASNVDEARALIKALDPDVITLDIRMPGMDGLDFLERIMRLRPTPVVMVSSWASADGEERKAAFDLGAVDCFDKSRLHREPEDLCERVYSAASTDRKPLGVAIGMASQHREERSFRSDAVIAIGSSTGGVEALVTLLSEFPENCPATLIVQHLPQLYTASFAARLNRLSRAHVVEARSGAPLKPGVIYLAPGGDRHLEIGGDTLIRCRLVEGEKVSGHTPSVDVLFNSVAKTIGANAVGAILTGMGGDGASGLKAMRSAGSHTIGQDKASCVVYGMPQVAFRMGAVCEQLPLLKIGARLLELCET